MDLVTIALGMFDGVHLGHRELIKRTVDEARINGDRSVVFTYENHPKELFCGSFEYVSTLQQREFLIHTLGADSIDAVPFTWELSSMLPDEFIRFLNSRYHDRISAVVCGYDYRFGNNALGDHHTLSALGKKYGFRVIMIDPVLYNGIPCSSTRVRDEIRTGNMIDVCGMLDRPYILSGTVVHNRSIGKRIGYPTANMIPKNQILPKDGVYATAFISGHKIYPSVTNIGCNPTVGGIIRSVETHVINIEKNLYGRDVSVLFFERLRDEICFTTIEDLSHQIAHDASEAQKIYIQHEKSVYKFADL